MEVSDEDGLDFVSRNAKAASSRSMMTRRNQSGN
jgi:hypothetical protein